MILGSESISFLSLPLDKLFENVFRYILFLDFDSNLISHAGDGLLVLSMSRQDKYQQMVQNVLSQQSQVHMTRLTTEFKTLENMIIKIYQSQMDSISKGIVTRDLSNLPHLKEYRETFVLFVIRVRGVLRIK